MDVTPTDEDFDNMHHAIGNRGIECAYRNNYCTEAGSDTAKRFEALGFWTRMRTINEGRDVVYSVNLKGLDALQDWLKRQPAE